MPDAAVQITVIVPVFNAATTVHRAASSVLDHTRASVELLCIDDGSSDHSASVLDRLAADDSRVRVLHPGRNQGVSTARNLGLDSALGAWVSFLDADDEVVPGALDRLLAVALEAGSDMAVGHVLGLDRPPTAGMALRNGAGRVLKTRLRESPWLQSVSGHHCGNLYRRQLLEQHHIRFAADLALGEDQLFQATVMVRADAIAIIEDTVYLYHHYSGSSLTTRLLTPKNLSDDLEWQRRSARLFLDHGLQRAGLAFLRDWSYSIENYWFKIPADLSRQAAGEFFESLRALQAEFDVEPWHETTPARHRYLLGLIMAGQDEAALAYLATPAARGPA